MSAPFVPAEVAERALNRCCEGDPWPTARNLVRFLIALFRLASYRCWDRVRNQPRSVYRWRRNPEFGGRT